MLFQDYIQRNDPVIPIYIEIGQRNAIWLERLGSAYNFRFEWAKISPLAREFLEMVLRQESQSAICEVFCLSRLFAGGLKTFEVPDGIMESFEHYDLNLVPADYHQPFPTFVIDFPEEFSKRHTTKDERGREQIPLLGILDYSPQFNSLHTVISMSNEMALTYHLDLNPEREGETIEEILVRHRGRTLTGLRQTSEDWRIGELILRAGINVSLMTTYYGVRELGPPNPSHFQRTQDRLAKAVKRKDQKLIDVNQKALWKIPYCYGFNRTAPLFTKATESKQGNVGEARGHVEPHWRRGHWRRQRYGVGLSMTKVIAVPAVFVNSDLALGGSSATSTIYK